MDTIEDRYAYLNDQLIALLSQGVTCPDETRTTLEQMRQDWGQKSFYGVLAIVAKDEEQEIVDIDEALVNVISDRLGQGECPPCDRIDQARILGIWRDKDILAVVPMADDEDLLAEVDLRERFDPWGFGGGWERLALARLR